MESGDDPQLEFDFLPEDQSDSPRDRRFKAMLEGIHESFRRHAEQMAQDKAAQIAQDDGEMKALFEGIHESIKQQPPVV